MWKAIITVIIVAVTMLIREWYGYCNDIFGEEW